MPEVIVISEGNDKRMVVIKEGKKSITQHQIKENGKWVHGNIKEELSPWPKGKNFLRPETSQ